jgi:tetratricopeptide (TPR) repeat protein/transcriptional regulator with XRE-family HTH domain
MADPQPISLGKRLKQERKNHHWTQKQLAEKLGSATISITRWENDESSPSPFMRDKLTTIFGKSLERWGISKQTRMNLPFPRNRDFIGREQFLARLYQILAADNVTVSSQACAISGIGGIGKTQTALEFAYRYAHDYNAVLWVRADSREMLISDFAGLAHELDLPEKEQGDQFLRIVAVNSWLEKNLPWLLIFDNASNLDLATDFLPRCSGGATLVTTRSTITGTFIKKMPLKSMNREEGTSFLSRHLASQEEDEETVAEELSTSERSAAETIWKLMDGLPLGLDQVAAYVEENQCGLADYLSIFQAMRKMLLQKRGSLRQKMYPDAVATTWLLSFQEIEQANPAASELLRFCAFLCPDEIPEEIIGKGIADLGSHLCKVIGDQHLWNNMIHTLLQYSLVQRNPQKKILRFHRMVQAVLQDMLNEDNKRSMSENAMRVINAAFPEAEYATWPQCERLLMQALFAAQTIEEYHLVSKEAGNLLSKTATYLRERALYGEAEPLLKRAIAIYKQCLGENQLETALGQNNLAELYRQQGKFEQAELLLLEALAIRKQLLGIHDPVTARNLNNLAILYWQMGIDTKAEPLFLEAIGINEQCSGKEHPDVARSMLGLANLYLQQGNYAKAKPLYLRTLAIYERELAADHPHLAACRNNLAELYRQLGEYEHARLLLQQALSIFEHQVGAVHPDTARCLNNLAELYWQQGEYEQAEAHFQRSISIYGQLLVADHLDTAEALYGLAKVYQQQGKSEEALSLLQRAIAIREKRSEKNHPETQKMQKDYIEFLQARKSASGSDQTTSS